MSRRIIILKILLSLTAGLPLGIAFKLTTFLGRMVYFPFFPNYLDIIALFFTGFILFVLALLMGEA